ncbi:MAG: hypothetical protein FJ100_05040 [Deltaproteobacteria bacterium]|nr:hypothetical protein [Deltaproteobacteria bacterium]
MARPSSKSALGARALLLMCVPLGASSAWSAEGPRGHSTSAKPLHAAGIAVPVVDALVGKVESAADAGPGQWLAQVTLSSSGVEAVRVEVYANPRASSAADWVAVAWKDLARSVPMRPVGIGLPRWKALRGDVPASPQSHARSVAFVAAGPRLLHVACILPDAVARARCDAVLAGLANAGAP